MQSLRRARWIRDQGAVILAGGLLQVRMKPDDVERFRSNAKGEDCVTCQQLKICIALSLCLPIKLVFCCSCDEVREN